MGRGDQVGGVRRSLGVSESLLRQSLLEIDTATFARMVSRGLLHGKTFLSRPLTVRIYFKFSVTQFDNVLCEVRGEDGSACIGYPVHSLARGCTDLRSFAITVRHEARASPHQGPFRDMDPGLCCPFVTPQTRRHTGQSIPGHQAEYGYVMSMNVSTQDNSISALQSQSSAAFCPPAGARV